jgi:hypothetical protein
MGQQKNQEPLAVSPEEAAKMLGISRDFFDEHVKPFVRVARIGRRNIVPIQSLQDWLDTNAVSIA